MIKNSVTEAVPPGLFRAYVTVFVLMVAFMVAMIDRVVLSLLVDPIQNEIGLTETQFGLLNGFAFALFYMVASVPLGRLADRKNRRLIIATGIGVWSVMAAFCGLAQTTAQLFLARVGVGAGEASLSPAAYSMMADLFPPDRLGRVYSIFASGALIGFGLSFLLGGIVIDVVDRYPDLFLPGFGLLSGWRIVLLASAVPGIVVALLVLAVREPARRQSTKTAAAMLERAKNNRPAFWNFVKGNGKFLGSYFLAFGCLGSALFGSLAWLPSMLTRTYDIDRATTGIVLGIGIGLAAPLGAIVGGLLSDRLFASGHREAPLIVGQCGAIGAFVFFLVLPFSPNGQTAVAVVSCLFFCLTLPTSAGPAGIQLSIPHGIRGEMTGLYVLATGLAGMSIGTVTIALFTDYLFEDKAAVGYSIAAFGAIVCPVMAVTFRALQPSFTRRAAEVDAA